MIGAGQLNIRVTFQRRFPVGALNATRLGFADHGDPVWASFKESPARQEKIGFATVEIRNGMLTTRDSAWARGLTSSDRVLINGVQYAIENIRQAEQRDGAIRMFVTSVPDKMAFVREAEQRGEAVTVRRLVPNAAPIDVTARALVTGYAPEELTGGVNQGDRKVILIYDDLVVQNFPVPVRGNDKIILLREAPHRVLNVADVDDSTFRDAGTLAAYLIRATG